MTETTASPSKSHALGRRVRDSVSAYPAAWAIGVYAVVAIAATVAAYFAIFNQFAPYDDEGTLLLSLRGFAEGEVLYRDVYTVYGPFYYELFGGLFALAGLDVTTDASRSIVIVVWVAASLAFGLAAHRLTGRLALGVTGMIAAFSTLYVLVNEPMHPHGLSVLLLAAFVLVAVCWPTRRVGWAGAACGAAVAALALTKVNLGAFAIAAIAIAAVCTLGWLHERRWLRYPVIAAFLALPALILARDLGQEWVRELAVLEVLSMTAIVIAARPLRPERGDEEAALARWLLAAAAGFVATAVAIVGIVLLTGPTPAEVYDGVISQAVGVRDLLVLQFGFPPASVDWAIGAVLAATLTIALPSSGKPGIWSGLLRGVAGLAILLSVAHIAPIGLNPSAVNPSVLPMVLAWVAAVPLAGTRESSQRRFLRVLLPALAVTETLQVYPVGGSQTGIAAAAFVPVGALCLADALQELRSWATTRGALALERLRVVAAALSIALAGMFALESVLLPGASNAVSYNNNEKLPLPGASLLRIPASEVEIYTGLVNLLHRNRCTTFIGYPNIDSLYLWSGLPAPPPQPPNAWMEALDEAQQRRAVEALRASPRPCSIRNDERASFYFQTGPPEDLPLVHYALNQFRPAAQFGAYQFLLPKPSATAP